MTLSHPLPCALLVGASLLSAGVLLGPETQAASETQPTERGLSADERFGTPHGVVQGRTKVVSYTTRFHGDPTARPLDRVEGKFELRDFPFPSQGRYASVFFFRKGHFATHVKVQALADGQDPDLGRIELERIPQRAGAIVGALAKVTRGPDHGIVSYEAGRVMIRSQDGSYTLELPTEDDGTFQAPLPAGIYELSTLDHFSKPKWIRVRPRRSSLAVLEVSEPLPKPGEDPLDGPARD